MATSLLTTGKAARLCSVKSDTVLKWIKKGWLPATRTVGGHYRIQEQDVLSMLAREDPAANKPPEHTALCSRPVRCWEYMNNGPGAECRSCAAYQVRAAWCFRLVPMLHGNGHARRFCTGPCQECPYFRLIHGLPANVLVITQDEGLIQSLAKLQDPAVAFRFARRGYDASAIVSVFRPAFVVFDEAILESLGVALLEALADDPRTPGARILIAVRGGKVGCRIHSSKIFATVQEPFNAEEILALLRRFPVETLPVDVPAADRAEAPQRNRTRPAER